MNQETLTFKTLSVGIYVMGLLFVIQMFLRCVFTALVTILKKLLNLRIQILFMSLCVAETWLVDLNHLKININILLLDVISKVQITIAC
jgi:hypothetical protein